MHVSVPIEGTAQIIESTQISPLVSRCQVKVLYVDDKPNRNGSVITKDVAEKIGQNLPGSPIVGYYNGDTKDFEEHNKEFDFDDKTKKYGFIDTTQAYGFVPTDAKIWFQEFQDDDDVVRLYLCTEGIIWTTAYPETQRILESGNNQSMKLNEKTLQGNWAEDSNSGRRFFIVNEAIVENLCILGEIYEPCFEGGQIRKEFSLHDEFETLKHSVYMLQNALKEGGLKPMEENQALEQETPVAQEQEKPAEEFKKEEEEEKVPESKNSQDNSDKESSSENEDKAEGDEEDKKKSGKKEYNLTEIPEYVELLTKYTNLQQEFSALEQEKDALVTEIEPLRAFKLEKDREDKQAMIKSFYMLSDKDKEDVVANIDSYSLADIESKLSVICVRNKVNFADAEQPQQNPQFTFSLNSAVDQDLSAVPEWLKVAKQVEKEMK